VLASPPQLPEALRQVLKKNEHYVELPNSYQALKNVLLN